MQLAKNARRHRPLLLQPGGYRLAPRKKMKGEGEVGNSMNTLGYAVLRKTQDGSTGSGGGFLVLIIQLTES